MSVYLAYLRAHLKTLATHRADLAIGVGSTVLVNCTAILFISSIFRWLPAVDGWSFDQALFLMGLANLGRSVHVAFFDNFWFLGQEYVRTGRLDTLMTRPMSPLFQLIAERLNLDALGYLALGIALIAKASAALGLHWTLPALLLLAGTAVLSGLVFAALNLFAMSFSFRTTDAAGLAQALHALSDYARYPLPLFGKTVAALLTFAVPYGFVAFYPAQFFLGASDARVLGWTAVAAAAAWLVAGASWRLGLRAYSSAG